MSERMEKSVMDEILEQRGLKAITDKKKIKNGMTFQIGRKCYVRVGKYVAPIEDEKFFRFDEIKEKDITAIFKLNGNLMYEEKKEE